jgi:hypothetical protein
MKLNSILKTTEIINLFKKGKREKRYHRVVYLNNRKPSDTEDDITDNINRKLPKYAGNRIKTSKV